MKIEPLSATDEIEDPFVNSLHIQRQICRTRRHLQRPFCRDATDGLTVLGKFHLKPIQLFLKISHSHSGGETFGKLKLPHGVLN